MQDQSPKDYLETDNTGIPVLPRGLKVLTILTFIGSGLGLLGSLYYFYIAPFNYEGREKLMENMNSGAMPSWARSMMGDPDKMLAMIIKSYENRVPILLLSLVAVGLCIAGAIQMRKLKKEGFVLYTIGELLPILVSALFIGTFALSGFGFYFGVCIALVFIFLYSQQMKNLKGK